MNPAIYIIGLAIAVGLVALTYVIPAYARWFAKEVQRQAQADTEKHRG